MRLLVLGGGQLALMMCWAAARLPMEFSAYDPDPRAPAYRCAKKAEDLLRAVDEADYVTYEFENIDEAVADNAQRQRKPRPHIDYLKLKKNRIAKRDAGGPGRPGAPVDRGEEPGRGSRVSGEVGQSRG
jgi:5-(carboxyamino)imidazole ribonucleotide synthase